MENDKVKALIEQAQKGALEVFTSEKYLNYLVTMSKFHRYSFRNTLLIYLQNPEASLVAGYRAWQDNFDRQVKKGEKGIKILGFTPYKKRIKVDTGEKDENGEPIYEEKVKEIPAFTPVSVFDISQTEGKEISLTSDLTNEVKDSENFISALVKISTVPIEFKEIQKYGVKGYFSFDENKIVVRSSLPPAQQIKTLIHEITHSELHSHPDTDEEKQEVIDRHVEEIEAESTAFVVCSHFGIDTSEYSFPYLAVWSKNHDLKEMETSLNTIQTQSSRLISRIEQALGLDIKKETKKEIEPQKVEVRENKELNRIQIIFSEKPSQSILAELKKNGFHWASKEKAWQRPLNAEGKELAKSLIANLEKVETTTTTEATKQKAQELIEDKLPSDSADFKTISEQLKTIEKRVSKIIVNLQKMTGLYEEPAVDIKLSLKEAKIGLKHSFPIGVADNGVFKFAPSELKLEDFYNEGDNLVLSPFLQDGEALYLRQALSDIKLLDYKLYQTKEFSFATEIIKDFVSERFTSSSFYSMAFCLAEKLSKNDTEYVKDFIDTYVVNINPKKREAIIPKYKSFLNKLSDFELKKNSFKTKLEEAQKKSELTHSTNRKERTECLQ